MTDIVDDFLLRLQQHVPDLQTEVRLKIEKDVRQQWGGTEPYVGKRISRVTRVMLVSAGLRQRKSLKECFEYASVSRRTGYRIIGGK